MQLVNHHRSHAPEQSAVIDPDGDHDRLDRLRRDQKDLRGIAERTPAGSVADVAVPETGPEADERGVALNPWLDVVEQGLERADVEHREAAPPLGRHTREQGKHRRLRLAPGSWGEEKHVLASHYRL